MTLETYTGTHIRSMMARAEADLGPDVVMVHLRPIPRWDGQNRFELVAVDADSAAALRETYLTRGNAAELTAVSPIPRNSRRSPEPRPMIVALIGPTGAGKTTTVAKLAANPTLFGGRRTGLVSFDTYRVGAVEQLRAYAEIARLPFEVVYNERDVAHAMRRLNTCEVILVDCPGWGPKNDTSRRTIEERLRRVNPDETHLVLPVSMRAELAARHIDDYGVLGVTHLLPTKLDEAPDDWSLFDLAAAHRYPMRWMTDGQEVPRDIRPASARLMAAFATHVRASGGPIEVV